jgi:hypothetical protein
VYYCGGTCKKADRAKHKIECPNLATKFERDSKQIEHQLNGMLSMLNFKDKERVMPETFHRSLFDLLTAAWEAFMGSPELLKCEMAQSYVPFERLTEGNVTYYKMKQVPLYGRALMKAYLDNGFRLKEFWKIWLMEKSGIINSVVVTAMRELMVKHGFSFFVSYIVEENGERMTQSEEIDFYGLAAAKVSKPYNKIAPVYEWNGDDPTKWKKTTDHTESTTVMFARTDKTERFVIDLTCPKYDIYEWYDSTYPYHCKDAQKDEWYQITKIRSPEENDRQLAQMYQLAAEMNQGTPRFMISCKQYIVNKLLTASA